jgi:uncharacterized protein (UPF0303 family)
MNNTSESARDLAIIAKQEELLQFNAFDNTTAWQLGESIKNYCESENLAVTIEIRHCRETVFFFAMSGTSPNNADWARRKRNTTELQQRSSYAVGLALTEGETLQTQSGLPMRDYAHHGGGVPIRVKGVGFVGVVTISGLPQREDHNIVVQAMADFMGVTLAPYQLP